MRRFQRSKKKRGGNGEDNDAVVNSMINLLKRIEKIDARLRSVEDYLSGKFKMPKPKREEEDSAWASWARNALFKVLEWTFVIIAAIVGVKLAGA
jgi:hypothetical protein